MRHSENAQVILLKTLVLPARQSSLWRILEHNGALVGTDDVTRVPAAEVIPEACTLV
jgi:hypothetical protein